MVNGKSKLKSLGRGAAAAALALSAVASLPAVALGHAPSGAIFTTLADGSEVNLNQFPSKEAVYLDGGPGPGAPKTAAGLDNGTYVFMVTDPSGKVLLSTDAAQCREFEVSGGVITAVTGPVSCQHATGADIDHPPARTVQLFPFADTPNPGGVYKVWVTRLVDFPATCLTAVDCDAAGTKHGFGPAHSKTDNFKVVGDSARQIDARFFRDRNRNGHYDAGEESLSGMKLTWTDTIGVNNIRYSDPQFMWGTVAHIEVPETDNGAVHYLTLADQPGCKVGMVHVNDFDAVLDKQKRLAIDVTGNYDYFVDVACR